MNLIFVLVAIIAWFIFIPLIFRLIKKSFKYYNLNKINRIMKVIVIENCLDCPYSWFKPNKENSLDPIFYCEYLKSNKNKDGIKIGKGSKIVKKNVIPEWCELSGYNIYEGNIIIDNTKEKQRVEKLLRIFQTNPPGSDKCWM